MIFYIINPLSKGEDAIYECMIFWDEVKTNWFNIDLHTTFYPVELLKEYRNNLSKFTDEQFEEFLKDVESISDFRLWLWEYSGVNYNEVNHEDINSVESSAAMDKVVKHCEEAINAFAEKYNYQVKID